MKNPSSPFDPIQTGRGLLLDVTVRLPHGLHSRPSARLAQLAREYDASVLLISANAEVDAKSTLELLSLALQPNDHVKILASGPQAREALLAIAALLSDPGE
ncbi:MAG: HPr family phosphocarrier protein [Desulfovibrio sp.]|nr:HPr family phosphocarrier protein [Desulfovibrio sp.]